MTHKIACIRSELSDACVKNDMSMKSRKIRFRGFFTQKITFQMLITSLFIGLFSCVTHVETSARDKLSDDIFKIYPG